MGKGEDEILRPKNFTLRVSDPRTEDDDEAEKIVRALIDDINEVDPGATLTIKPPDEPWTLPKTYLRVGRSVYAGLDEINAMAKQERMFL